jgi:hypothetical protein
MKVAIVFLIMFAGVIYSNLAHADGYIFWYNCDTDQNHYILELHKADCNYENCAYQGLTSVENGKTFDHDFKFRNENSKSPIITEIDGEPEQIECKYVGGGPNV